MVKRLPALIFLSLLLLNLAGAYVYFFVRLQAIKSQMRAEMKNLPTHDLEILKLTVAEFERARVDEEEVKVAGKMYDIARIEQHGAWVTLYVLHDEAEDNLLSLLDAILKNSTKDKKPVPTAVAGLHSLDFLLSNFSFTIPASTIVAHATPFFETSSNAFVRTEGPPPRLALLLS